MGTVTRPPDADAALPTRHGGLRIRAYRNEEGREHAALYLGTQFPAAALVRIHSECLTGDAFSSLKCDCGPQLDEAIKRIVAEGEGVIVYLRQEGRSIGLVEKVRAYQLQDRGMDTVDANVQLGHPIDARSYEDAVAILADFGITSVRLLSNNPAKAQALRDAGIEVVEEIPLFAGAADENAAYLDTKKTRMGHRF